MTRLLLYLILSTCALSSGIGKVGIYPGSVGNLCELSADYDQANGASSYDLPDQYCLFTEIPLERLRPTTRINTAHFVAVESEQRESETIRAPPVG